MEKETPAEAIVRWLRMPGPAQAFVRWLALIPGVICIYLFSQLIILIGVSLIVRSSDEVIGPWAINMLNAAFVPFVIIKFGTPIAPSLRQQVSGALAVVAICVIALPRLALTLSNPQQTGWGYGWLAVSAVLLGWSAWFGIRNHVVPKADTAY